MLGCINYNSSPCTINSIEVFKIFFTLQMPMNRLHISFPLNCPVSACSFNAGSLPAIDHHLTTSHTAATNRLTLSCPEGCRDTLLSISAFLHHFSECHTLQQCHQCEFIAGGLLKLDQHNLRYPL